MSKKYHYVYKLIDRKSGEYYFGSRSCNNIPQNDDYMGSPTTWNPNIERLDKIILKSEFESRRDAIKYEKEIIKKHIDEALNRNYAIPSLGSVGTILKYQKKREKYRDNPTRCKHCDKSLLYNRRNYTYCGQDCYDLYIEEKKMKEPDLTLTSVKLIPELYDKFKVEKISNNNSLTLQQLVNRSIELYLSDSKYRKRLDKYNELQISGSGF